MGVGVSTQNRGSNKFPLHLSLSNNKVDQTGTSFEKLYPIWCIAISPNGKQLAAASSDNKIHLWCLVAYQLLISLTGHGDTIWCVQYSPDSRVLASASSDGTIRLWEVDTGFPVNILRAHAVWVWHLQFAPESRFFASGGADTRIFLWDYAQPQPLLGVTAHGKSVTGISFSATDQRKMVTVGGDAMVTVTRHVNWNMPSCELRARLSGHIGTINFVAMNPVLEHLMVSGGEDCVLRLWNLKDLTKEHAVESLQSRAGYNLEHHLLPGHTETVWRGAFSKCGRILATAASDTTVRVWNVSSKKCTLNFVIQKAHASWVRDCLFDFSNQFLFSASTDGLVSLWRVPAKYAITPGSEKGNKK